MAVIDFNNAARQGELKPGNIDADSLRQRLNADPKGFVAWLFSGRAIIGKHEARIGDKYGTAGESLAIQLTGPDAGMWYDHATAEGGDLISLYQAYMGYDRSRFQLALKEIAAEYFGDATVQVARPAWQPSAEQRIAEKKAKLGDKPKAENLELGAPVENYPYHDRAGNILAVVRRYEPGGLDETGKPKKTFRASPSFPSPRPLYRVPQIIQVTHVVLTEGERKANALASLGIEATTAMGGANTKIEEVDWSPLAGKTVTLWPDKDEAGESYMRRVAPVLTSLGCQVAIVTPPADKPAKWDAHDCVAEGGDCLALINGAVPVVATAADKTAPTAIPVINIGHLRSLPPLEWVLEGWVPADSLGFVYGDPGCGKSFTVLDWCLHLSYGMADWHGVPLNRHGPILYILQEGGRGIVDRIDAFKQHHGLIDDPEGFEIITAALSFMDETCVDALVSTVNARGKQYRLIVVDTVSRVLPGADENLQKEMTIFIQACDRLRRATEAGVIGVHHAGKSGDMRGSTVLRGAGDFVFKLEKEKGVKPITVTCEKIKDEEDGWQRVLKIEKINLTAPNKLDLNKQKSSLVVTGMAEATEGDGWPPREVCQQILDAIAQAWDSDRPWSNASQTRGEGRYAPRNISIKFNLSAKTAAHMIETWLVNGILAIEYKNRKANLRGLKPIGSIQEVAKVHV